MFKSTGVNSSSYAVRFRFIAYYLGLICISMALFSLVPILYIALDIQRWSQVLPFLSVSISLGFAGLAMCYSRPQGELQLNEALVIVVLAFLVATFSFSIPMYALGLPFVDSVFESASGITTTGLSTLADIQNTPPSIIFMASWLQWMGGLGIMVLAFALLFGQGLNSKRLTEAMGEQTSSLGGSRAYARIVFSIYLVLTLLGICLIKLFGANWFDAINLGLAAISTGGYSPYNASLSDLGEATQYAVTMVAISGALAMPIYYSVWKRDWKRVLRDPELYTFLIILALLSLALGWVITLQQHGSFFDHISKAFLTLASAQTTAGFSVIPLNDLQSDGKLILIISMFIGGQAGSTAGGFKIIRLLILLRLIQLLVRRSSLSEHAVSANRFLGKTWDYDTLITVLLIMFLHVMTVVISWLIFLIYGYDPLNSLFDVVSAVSTVGISSGVVSPHLPEPLKWLLCADMLLGRLEFMAILVFLAPRTWMGQRRSKQGTS